MRQGTNGTMKNLDPKKFDEVVAPRAPAPIIWGAKAIGQRIGRSPEFVRRTLAKEPNSPLRCMGGQLYVIEHELLEFFGIGTG